MTVTLFPVPITPMSTLKLVRTFDDDIFSYSLWDLAYWQLRYHWHLWIPKFHLGEHISVWVSVQKGCSKLWPALFRACHWPSPQTGHVFSLRMALPPPWPMRGSLICTHYRATTRTAYGDGMIREGVMERRQRFWRELSLHRHMLNISHDHIPGSIGVWQTTMLLCHWQEPVISICRWTLKRVIE
jgi:hypothetical protein